MSQPLTPAQIARKTERESIERDYAAFLDTLSLHPSDKATANTYMTTACMWLMLANVNGKPEPVEQTPDVYANVQKTLSAPLMTPAPPPASFAALSEALAVYGTSNGQPSVHQDPYAAFASATAAIQGDGKSKANAQNFFERSRDWAYFAIGAASFDAATPEAQARVAAMHAVNQQTLARIVAFEDVVGTNTRYLDIAKRFAQTAAMAALHAAAKGAPPPKPV